MRFEIERDVLEFFEPGIDFERIGELLRADGTNEVAPQAVMEVVRELSVAAGKVNRFECEKV